MNASAFFISKLGLAERRPRRAGAALSRLGTALLGVGASLRALGASLEPNEVSARAMNATAASALTRI